MVSILLPVARQILRLITYNPPLGVLFIHYYFYVCLDGLILLLPPTRKVVTPDGLWWRRRVSTSCNHLLLVPVSSWLSFRPIFLCSFYTLVILFGVWIFPALHAPSSQTCHSPWSRVAVFAVFRCKARIVPNAGNKRWKGRT